MKIKIMYYKIYMLDDENFYPLKILSSILGK